MAKPPWLANVLGWTKRHLVALGVVTSPVLAWLAGNLVDWLTDDWLSREVWEPMRRFLAAWAAQPIGYAGFVALLWTVAGILFLLALGLLERSKTAAWLRERLNRKKQAKPKPLSPDDKVAIAAIRGLWNTDGQAPGERIEYLATLLDNALYQIHWPWLKYYRNNRHSLEQARRAFNDALNSSEVTPLKDVKESFEKWFWAYKAMLYDIARVLKSMPEIATNRDWDLVEAWRSDHAHFYKEVEKLCAGWPEFSELKVGCSRRGYWVADDNITGDFVWPLPRPSTSDTEGLPSPAGGA